MIGPVRSSAIMQQLAILQEALEAQKASPHFEEDLRCVEEMCKLRAVVAKTRPLDLYEINTLYTALSRRSWQYFDGMARLSSHEPVRIFNFPSVPTWKAGEAALRELSSRRDALIIRLELEQWESMAERGENRAEAGGRLMSCFLGKPSGHLNLRGLNLKTLPDIFDKSGFIKHIQFLDISKNKLTALPESLNKLRELKNLYIDENRLVALPESLSCLITLERLSITNNRLRTLPGNLGRLVGLKSLSVENNPALTGVPNGILQLPDICQVFLEGCSLSASVLESLERYVRDADGRGPTIHYSMLDTPSERDAERPTLELLQDLFQISGRMLHLPNLINSPGQERKLQMWLGRLCDIADYKSGGDKKKGLANNILTYLEKANNDAEFQEVFYLIIDGATRTCGDRVALSLMHLGIAHDLRQVNLFDSQMLAGFLVRGVFIMSLLEDIGRAKVASLRFVDEIEVYLGYPVMLKERLQIPINTDQMLYPSCSHITSLDLDAAINFVRRQIESEETVCNFLISQDKWKESLSQKYPAAIREMEERKKISLEGLPEDAGQEAYIEIEKQFNAGLIELSKRALVE